MMQTEPVSSPVGDLAARHLQHKSITLPPKLQLAHVERVIAASGLGLDHTIGERACAFGDALGEPDLKAFFLLTDRRLAGRQHLVSLTTSRISRFQTKLSDITQVEWIAKPLRRDLQIHTGTIRWTRAGPGGLLATTCALRRCLPPRQLND
jgi:hypothetical protein